MLKKILFYCAAVALLILLVLHFISLPRTLDASLIPQHKADLQNGETLFWAGGCASCHAQKEARAKARLMLGGGVELETPFGVFIAPNISPDRQAGIGSWNTAEFINAMVNGVSPDSTHYFPAFPYPNYRSMPYTDLIDLKAFLDTLPPISSATADHRLHFPFNIRAAVGLWKLLYLNTGTFSARPGVEASVERGRYLVNGPGHCAACHTPRDLFGGEIKNRLLAGARSLDSASSTKAPKSNRIPNITPHAEDGIGKWSENDIAYALESGFDPDFDSFGGSMVEVQENMAHLPASDRLAIARYLKSIPALASTRD